MASSPTTGRVPSTTGPAPASRPITVTGLVGLRLGMLRSPGVTVSSPDAQACGRGVRELGERSDRELPRFVLGMPDEVDVDRDRCAVGILELSVDQPHVRQVTSTDETDACREECRRKVELDVHLIARVLDADARRDLGIDDDRVDLARAWRGTPGVAVAVHVGRLL